MSNTAGGALLPSKPHRPTLLSFTPEGTIEGTYTFTGGTGRFEGASGQADFVAIPNADLTAATITFNGTIRY